MDLASAAAGIRATRQSLLRAGIAGWSSWRTWAGATSLGGLNDHATFLERADAPVRRTGLGAITCVSRRGRCRVLFFLHNSSSFNVRQTLEAWGQSYPNEQIFLVMTTSKEGRYGSESNNK